MAYFKSKTPGDGLWMSFSCFQIGWASMNLSLNYFLGQDQPGRILKDDFLLTNTGSGQIHLKQKNRQPV